MAAAVRSETDFPVLTLAVFSVCHGLRDGEAANIRKFDITQPGWISFYDRNIPQSLPLFSEAELQRRILWGTPWTGVTRHCWRPLVAVAMFAPMWNRWTSQRQAWEYAVSGPDWELELGPLALCGCRHYHATPVRRPTLACRRPRAAHSL